MMIKNPKIKIIIILIFGIFFIIAGISHFINPEKYFGFIPDFLPKASSNYLAGFVEIIAGALLFLGKLRKWGGFIILIMMVVFLPLHIMDVCRDKPIIGSQLLAIIRLPMQLLLIYWAWYIFKNN